MLALVAAVASAKDRDRERDAFRSAYASVSRNPNGDWKKLAIGLGDYPLYPYLEATALRKTIRKADRADVARFLERWPATLPAADLREAWLRELARREDWKTFRAFYDGETDRDLRCDDLKARLAAGEALDFERDVEPLWNSKRATPDACDPVFARVRADGSLTDARVWQRLEAAAADGNVATAANVADLLGGTQHEEAERIVAAIRDPATTLAKADAWSDTPRARDAVSYGLARYARRNSAATETLWAKLQSAFKWDAAQKNRILNAVALYRSTSFSDDALARLKALPADAADDATREWRVRVALASGDWNEALAALDALSDEQKGEDEWRYIRARVLSRLGRKDEADALFANVAREATFHGFLAADWIGAPYAICPATLAEDPGAEKAIATQPDLVRAFEFHALDMLRDARREWAFALTKLDPKSRRLAADLAYRRGWYDRAVFLYSGDPDTQKLYEQRFPLAIEQRVRREAHDAGIDPAWVYAIIRAESAWMTDAHSHADAYGLMQLLPAVAKALAHAEKIPYGAPSDLFDPALNVELGTRYLGRMAEHNDGNPWLASAAYNAGEAAVARWVAARGTLDPDFFIETIPYHETREYVARVLAFSVIYDWRMNGKALSLSSRMPRIGESYSAPNEDTPRKPVACPLPIASKDAAEVALGDRAASPPH